jgi:hypothetical protein
VFGESRGFIRRQPLAGRRPYVWHPRSGSLLLWSSDRLGYSSPSGQNSGKKEIPMRCGSTGGARLEVGRIGGSPRGIPRIRAFLACALFVVDNEYRGSGGYPVKQLGKQSFRVSVSWPVGRSGGRAWSSTALRPSLSGWGIRGGMCNGAFNFALERQASTVLSQ